MRLILIIIYCVLIETVINLIKSQRRLSPREDKIPVKFERGGKIGYR